LAECEIELGDAPLGPEPKCELIDDQMKKDVHIFTRGSSTGARYASRATLVQLNFHVQRPDFLSTGSPFMAKMPICSSEISGNVCIRECENPLTFTDRANVNSKEKI
jgi:hypothetical protein